MATPGPTTAGPQSNGLGNFLGLQNNYTVTAPNAGLYQWQGPNQTQLTGMAMNGPQIDKSAGAQNMAQNQQVFQNQNDLAKQLQDTAAGRGMSAADAQLQKAAGLQAATQLSQARSARGPGASLAAQNAANANAQTFGNTAANLAVQRAQESATAQNLLSSVYNQQGQNQLTAAGQLQQQAGQQANLNQQQELGFYGLANQAAGQQLNANTQQAADQLAAQEANQQASAQNVQAQGTALGLVGGAVNGVAGAIGSMFSSDIKGKQDIQPISDKRHQGFIRSAIEGPGTIHMADFSGFSSALGGGMGRLIKGAPADTSQHPGYVSNDQGQRVAYEPASISSNNLQQANAPYLQAPVGPNGQPNTDQRDNMSRASADSRPAPQVVNSDPEVKTGAQPAGGNKKEGGGDYFSPANYLSDAPTNARGEAALQARDAHTANFAQLGNGLGNWFNVSNAQPWSAESDAAKVNEDRFSFGPQMGAQKSYGAGSGGAQTPWGSHLVSDKEAKKEAFHAGREDVLKEQADALMAKEQAEIDRVKAGNYENAIQYAARTRNQSPPAPRPTQVAPPVPQQVAPPPPQNGAPDQVSQLASQWNQPMGGAGGGPAGPTITSPQLQAYQPQIRSVYDASTIVSDAGAKKEAFDAGLKAGAQGTKTMIEFANPGYKVPAVMTDAQREQVLKASDFYTQHKEFGPKEMQRHIDMIMAQPKKSTTDLPPPPPPPMPDEQADRVKAALDKWRSTRGGLPYQDAGAPPPAPAPAQGDDQRLAQNQEQEQVTSDKRAKKKVSVPGGRDTVADKYLDTLTDSMSTYRYKDPNMEPSANPHGGRYLGIMAQALEKSPTGDTLVQNGPRGKYLEMGPNLSAALAGLGRVNEKVDVALDAIAKEKKTKKGKKRGTK